MKYLTMTGFTVRTSSDRWTLGYEGENNSRTLQIKTTDDLTDFATVNLLIDTLDCGAMTVTTVGNFKVLSMVLTAGMLGEAGKKTCQLLMMDSEGTVIKKTNQFQMVVGMSNAIEGTVPESPVIIIITDYIDDAINERVGDEILEGKINDWLDDHPEATTTVQDGSITEAKLHDGAVTDSKTADEYRNLYYDEVTVETGRTSNTDYYLATVPKFDSDDNLIPLSLSYSSTLNPLEQAWKKSSTITVNGYGSLQANGASRNGIGICDGVVTTNFSFEGIAPDNCLYIGVKADRTIIEYKMNSAVTPQVMLNDGCLNVFNAYFKLVENGQVVSELSDGTITINSTTITETMRNPLMLMGIKSNGDIVFMACDGRTIINDGLTYREAGEILISQGCETVYNLDGGGSACLVVKGSKLNRNIDGNGTVVRNVHYALNVVKPSLNTPTKSAYAKIGAEKQNIIEQIIPYVNGVYDSLPSKIGTNIVAGTDLNDVVVDGKYYCTASSIAQRLTNCPVNVGFSMYVMKQGGTGRAYTQIIITNPTSSKQLIYYRFILISTTGTVEQTTSWYVITSTAAE